jgi:hypothetical protein
VEDVIEIAYYGGELKMHESVKTQTLSQLDTVQKVASTDATKDWQKITLLLIVDTDMHKMVNAAGSRFNQGEANIVVRHVQNWFAWVCSRVNLQSSSFLTMAK